MNYKNFPAYHLSMVITLAYKDYNPENIEDIIGGLLL
jgi:hypothetical protein